MRAAHELIAPTLRHPVISGQHHPVTAFRLNGRVRPKEPLGERIERLRRAAGYRKRTELSTAAGIPYSTLAEIETKGQESTRVEYLVRLADALRVSVRELCGGDPEQSAAHLHRLSAPETALLNAYRAATPAERREIDAYIAGIASRPSRSKRRPLAAGAGTAQTLQSRR